LARNEKFFFFLYLSRERTFAILQKKCGIEKFTAEFDNLKKKLRHAVLKNTLALKV